MSAELLAAICQLDTEDAGKRNEIKGYLPIRNKGNEICFPTVSGGIICRILGKRPKRKIDLATFRDHCASTLHVLIGDEKTTSDILALYFSGTRITPITPSMFAAYQFDKPSSSTEHLSKIFATFLDGEAQNASDNDCNFIEQVIAKVLKEQFDDDEEQENEAPYLPFLASLFNQDLRFLLGHSDYFCQSAERFMQLYAFLYCTQLALNIQRFDGENPSSQPVYFILDTEKASHERSKLRNSPTTGYQAVALSMARVFPSLAILEHINRHLVEEYARQPLWRYSAALLDEDPQLAHLQEQARKSLSDFTEIFKIKKSLPQLSEVGGEPRTKPLRQLIRYALAQFDEHATKPETKAINEKYVKAYEAVIAKHFIQSRGRMGRVFVLNQDFMLLLTNICIGEREQLRFYELLLEFQQRGVYFDRQSEQALLQFYERIGNVDRMSDSGDAVYVKRTI